MGLKALIKWATKEQIRRIKCTEITCEDCEHRDKLECSDNDRKYGGKEEQ